MLGLVNHPASDEAPTTEEMIVVNAGRRTWTQALFATIIGADLLMAGYVMGGINGGDLVSSPPADAATHRPDPPKSPGATTSTTAGHCDGTIAADKVNSVRVPDNATCILDGTTVARNVSVGHGAALVLRGADVGGDVDAKGARRVTITHGSSIGGGNAVSGDREDQCSGH